MQLAFYITYYGMEINTCTTHKLPTKHQHRENLYIRVRASLENVRIYIRSKHLFLSVFELLLTNFYLHNMTCLSVTNICIFWLWSTVAMVLVSECQIVIDDKFYWNGPPDSFCYACARCPGHKLWTNGNAECVYYDDTITHSRGMETIVYKYPVYLWCMHQCHFSLTRNIVFHSTVQTYELSVCEFCLLRI